MILFRDDGGKGATGGEDARTVVTTAVFKEEARDLVSTCAIAFEVLLLRGALLVLVPRLVLSLLTVLSTSVLILLF